MYKKPLPKVIKTFFGIALLLIVPVGTHALAGTPVVVPIVDPAPAHGNPPEAANPQAPVPIPVIQAPVVPSVAQAMSPYRAPGQSTSNATTAKTPSAAPTSGPAPASAAQPNASTAKPATTAPNQSQPRFVDPTLSNSLLYGMDTFSALQTRILYGISSVLGVAGMSLMISQFLYLKQRERVSSPSVQL